MKQQLNIYHKSRETVYERELILLEKWKTSKRNKELITSFHNFLFAEGSGDLRVAKLSSQLRRIATVMNKNLDKANEMDIEKVLAFYNKQKSLSEATKSDYRRAVKQFYSWRKTKDQRMFSDVKQDRIDYHKFYECISKISISYKIKKADPTTIINEDDINQVITKGCKTIRDKSFMKGLHETGVRAGELLTMKINSVKLGKKTSKIIVNGKTGLREVPIVTSVPYLAQYLELHPFKDNENSYLWLGTNPKRMHKPLRHKGAQDLINRCFKRAGVEKKHNLHWFRHSRASLLAPHLTEVMLCTFMGWTIGSRQVKNYVHLCNKQLGNTILRMNGLEISEDEQVKTTKRCSCGRVNDIVARYCYKCGRPMNVAIHLQDQEIINRELEKTTEMMIETAKNERLFKEFLEFKKKMEVGK